VTFVFPYPYRFPGASTDLWLTSDRRVLPGSVARLIIRECVDARAEGDPGPLGDWCRQIVAGRAAVVAS
jgi:hypothetical protein